MAQVVFLNRPYLPTWEESRRLDDIQDFLSQYNAELAYLSRDFDDNKKRIFKETSHRNLRKQMSIVKND